MELIVDINNLWLQVLFSLLIGYCINKNFIYENTYESIYGCLMKMWIIFLSLIITMNFLTIYLIEIFSLIIFAIISILLKMKRAGKPC